MSSSTVIPMNSTEIVAMYTEDLSLGRNPAKALQCLYTHGVTMKPFDDAGTEQLLEKYENDFSCYQPLQMLREKFAALRRREAKEKRIEEPIFEKEVIFEKQKVESSMSQESTNNLFCTAVQQVSTKKMPIKRVDYSKFKIIKRSKKVSQAQTETPKKTPSHRSFSFSSTVDSWSSESTDTSPEYQ